MNRRNFLRTIGGTGLVLAATAGGLSQCDQMPTEAIQGWNGPVNSITDREWLLSYALLAPNPHNMQAWIADLRVEDQIILFADKDRLLPDTDPFSRQVMIGQGTFLELLSIAASARGYQANVHLFPEGTPDEMELDISTVPIARIELVKNENIAADPLFSAILHRRSNKEGYRELALSEDHKAELLKLPLSGDHSVQIYHDKDEVEELRTFAKQAMLLEIETPRTLKESVDRTRIGADAIVKYRDGIDLNGPMFWWLSRFDLMSKEKAMTPGTLAYQGGIDYALGWVNKTYSMGILSSPTNSREDQIIAGRNYVRLNLLATSIGVAMHPVSQILQEYPEMQTLQSDFYSHLGVRAPETIQMFFRIGYQSKPSPSPRRPLQDIVRA
ncbi:Acg family FMN-binding oxidoreductase [Sneathiella limimaris]|uniref:Acg family FMN-binding oxidoreductase n=1 Tax=Sneathiella limimaris TaxID=1964213 RepID=UPI00146B835F|nr:twin-arginine translocation pathway signal protein [Sneathiella limimaris]